MLLQISQACLPIVSRNAVAATKEMIATTATATTITIQNMFPIHRIYCIGRNYPEHAKEMGHDPNRELPFFFQKPADAIVDTFSFSSSVLLHSSNGQQVPNRDSQHSKHGSCHDNHANNTTTNRHWNHSQEPCFHASTAGALGLHRCTIPYPPMTSLLHHEAELVIAIRKGGLRIPESEAFDHIFGYAVGCDLTRRDLQTEAKKLSRPWSTAKAFDFSAPCGPILPKDDLILSEGTCLTLHVNGQIRQSSILEAMIWKIPEIISHVSKYFRLRPGDLIFTGTPSGVSALKEGDCVMITCGDLPPCEFSIGPPE